MSLPSEMNFVDLPAPGGPENMVLKKGPLPEIKPGDILVTSGTGGLYPPNIPVAIVVRRQDDGALARPLADPGKVDAVSVLRPYTPDNIEAQGLPGPATPTAAAPAATKAP